MVESIEPVKRPDIFILDVTIRDGSYAIDYKYTPEQVSAIAGALDAAGVDCIEVSHGCGLGARENLGIPAAASDAEYVRAAKGAVKRSKIGVIAGPPPVTQARDIDSVIADVDFIRFAANCDKPRMVEENIAYARKMKPRLRVFFQLMRSSRRPKRDILKAAREVESMGADIVYLVDTAGHFIPEEVHEIIGTLAAKLKIGVGFHGHNNLGLAIANTLAAIDAGAQSVDASLKGIGRAGGNAQIEALVSLLHRRGLARKIDLDGLLKAGLELVRPIMPPQKGIEDADILTADANVDLYPLDLYRRIADAAGVGFAAFVRALARQIDVEADFKAIAKAIRAAGADPAAVFRALKIHPPK